MNSSAKRILVVDNEESALASMRDLLRQQDYAVATAQNAVQASDILRQQQFAVVLADQQTHVLTGVEFLAGVKKVQPDASRVLMASALSLSTVIEAINTVEIYRVIHKPWHREDLLLAVRSAVERYEAIIQSKLLLKTTQAMNETLAKLNQSLERQLAEARTERGLEKRDGDTKRDART